MTQPVTRYDVTMHGSPEPPPIPTANGLNASVIARAFNLTYDLGAVVSEILNGDLRKARWHLDQEIARQPQGAHQK